MSITSWTEKTTNNNQWYGVAYGNNTFVAVSASGTDNRVMTSTNYGETWNLQTLTNVNRNYNWRKIAFGNGRFVAISNSGGTDRVMVSTDNGETWSAKNAPNSNSWISITYGDDKFVAISENTGTTTDRVMVSTDYGDTWNAYDATEDILWASITYGNNMFVAVGRTGTNRIMISSDGMNWLPSSSAPNSNWRSVTYGQGKFVVVGNSGLTTHISTSIDGDTWTSLKKVITNDTITISRSIKYGSDNTGNELFVIGGDNGQILISSDPETSWSLSTSPNTNTMQSVAYGNGTFVGVSSTGSQIRAIISQSIPIPIPRCFKSGTYILCKTIDNENAKEEIKQIKVEDLTIGTLVKTKYDGFKPIVKIITGKIKNNPQYQHGVSEYNKNQLYVCPKDNFNELFEDLVITSNHSILVFPIPEDKKKQILDFMGDIYVTDRKYRVPACLDERCIVYPEEGTFPIYHFALEKECQLSNYGVFANGLLVETASIFDVNSDGH